MPATPRKKRSVRAIVPRSLLTSGVGVGLGVIPVCIACNLGSGSSVGIGIGMQDLDAQAGDSGPPTIGILPDAHAVDDASDGRTADTGPPTVGIIPDANVGDGASSDAQGTEHDAAPDAERTTSQDASVDAVGAASSNDP